MRELRRGDVYFAECRGSGSVQHGTRPVVIVSNDTCNRHSSVVTVVPLTSSIAALNNKAVTFPTHSIVDGFGLPKVSMALCEQVTALSVMFLRKYVGHIDDLSDIEAKLKVQLKLEV